MGKEINKPDHYSRHKDIKKIFNCIQSQLPQKQAKIVVNTNTKTHRYLKNN